jgi:hypothetical protein
MKIKRIILNRLRNEEWFNFFTEFKTFVEKNFPEISDIEALFVVFLELYAMADDTLEQVRKSNFTSLIIQHDEERDNIYRGLDGTVRVNLRHYDEGKRTAAKRLVTLFDHYGNVADKSYNEETATIYNFLQDIKNKYAPEIATLDLTGWIDELERTNKQFEETVLDRNSEYAGKTELNMLDIRKKTGRTYLDIVEQIEALSLVKGDQVYAPFIKTLNANIERYINTIKRRSGKNSAQSDNTESQEDNDGE